MSLFLIGDDLDGDGLVVWVAAGLVLLGELLAKWAEFERLYGL